MVPRGGGFDVPPRVSQVRVGVARASGTLAVGGGAGPVDQTGDGLGVGEGRQIAENGVVREEEATCACRDRVAACSSK